jgi:protein TonB
VTSPASSAPRTADAASADTQGAAASATGASSARVSCELIAVTTSDELLLELGEALGGRAAMRPVESLDQALEHLGSSRRLQLIAFDIRGVTDVRAAIERARAQYPQVVVLAFADGAVEPAQAANLQGADIFALLPVAVDRRKTIAALDGAISMTEKRGPPSHPARPKASVTIVTDAAPTTAPLTRALRLPTRTLIGAAVALALAVAAGGWLLLRSGTDTDADAPVAPDVAAAVVDQSLDETGEEDETNEEALQARPTEISLVRGSIDELLEKARLAMRQRRYTEPAADNALVYFRSALALDASNAEANDGLARVGAVLVGRVDEAIAAKSFEEATASLSAAKSAIPDDARLPALETRLLDTQVAAALAEDKVDRAAALARVAQRSGVVSADVIEGWRTRIAERQLTARVKRATELATERLGDGKLVEPVNDSAKRYVVQLRELAPASAATRRLEKQLTDAYLRKARENLLAGRTADADRWLTEAQAAGITAAEIASVRKDAAATQQRAAAEAEGDRLAQLARERIEAGQLTVPENDSATHYVTALRAAQEAHEALGPLRRELAAALLAQAGAAARAGNDTQTEADLTLARRFGASATDVQAVQQLASKEPAAEAPLRREVSLQKLLKRTRYIAPEYPQRALEKGIAGSVTVEYVVDANGETRDHKVTASEPEGVFDRAALAAVRRWRYEPVLVDEVPVEIPTRALIRFEVPAE